MNTVTVEAPAETTRLDLLAIIEDAIVNHPRSLQKRIGPSEIGTPCARRLGHKLAGTPEQDRGIAWRPTVGTAVHTWLEEKVAATTGTLVDPGRFHLEGRVNVGTIDGTNIHGSCDLFDTNTGTVVDYKIVGPTSLKKYKKGPNHTYRVQAHLYGLGWLLAGHQVDHVAIFVLPAAGELHDHVFWTEPFDEQLARQAMARANGIAKAGRIRGWGQVLPGLSTADDFCTHCPFFRRGTTDLVTGCPGHEGRAERRDAIDDLIA